MDYQNVHILAMIHLAESTPWLYSFLAYSFTFIFLFSFKELWNWRNEEGELDDPNIDPKILKQQKLIMDLREENLMLKAKLKSKTIELASKAKESNQKNDILTFVKSKLDEILKNPSKTGKNVKSSLKKIESGIQEEDNTFQMQMDELHQDFFERLREQYPDLTNNDLRLCAYLRKGFNSKEIAEYLNIKPSSIYISRSRLRKKLSLESDADLNAFLNSI